MTPQNSILESSDMNKQSAWLHNLDKVTKQEFRFLSHALRQAWEDKATGYIVTPNNDVIDIRKGKRRSLDGKRWIQCSK